jgi:hypothetical protein
LATIIIMPNVIMPSAMAIPPCAATAIASTQGRVKRGQTKAA